MEFACIILVPFGFHPRRDRKRRMKVRKRVFNFLLVFWLLGLPSIPNVIKNPRPCVQDKPLRKLKVVKEVSQFKGKFFVNISSMVIINGKLYVCDTALKKIFVFDPKLNYLKEFGRTGEGPGEFRKGTMGARIKLVPSLDGKIYVGEKVLSLSKIHVFTEEGESLMEFRPENLLLNFAVDDMGNLYLPSFHGGLVDVYIPEMPGLKFKTTLGKLDFITRDLLFPLPSINMPVLKRPFLLSSFSIFITKNRRLLILNGFNCKLKIIDLKTGKSQEKCLWTEKFLSSIRKEYEKRRKLYKELEKEFDKLRKEAKGEVAKESLIFVFRPCANAFTDGKHLLFVFAKNLYEYDDYGNLKAKYKVPEGVFILAKYGENFYGRKLNQNDEENLVLLREVKDEK